MPRCFTGPLVALYAAALVLASGAPSAVYLTDPAVTQATLGATVCRVGYTRTVRPPSYYTRRIKSALLAAAGLPADAGPDYELDHVMPLTLGGAPRDPGNLALEPEDEAKFKDKLERKLGCMVCTGAIGLDDARAAIAVDWRSAWQRFGTVVCHRRRR